MSTMFFCDDFLSLNTSLQGLVVVNKVRRVFKDSIFFCHLILDNQRVISDRIKLNFGRLFLTGLKLLQNSYVFAWLFAFRIVFVDLCCLNKYLSFVYPSKWDVWFKNLMDWVKANVLSFWNVHWRYLVELWKCGTHKSKKKIKGWAQKFILENHAILKWFHFLILTHWTESFIIKNFDFVNKMTKRNVNINSQIFWSGSCGFECGCSSDG